MKKETIFKTIIAVLVVAIIIMAIFIMVGRPKKVAPLPVKLKGRIVIVIDDWGYSLKNMPIVERIKYPLTASILPSLRYSSKAAKELHEMGFEIILHLPMEPKERYRLEKNTILISMDEQTIKKIMDSALTSVVFAKGVSNHQGSRATEDERTMEIIFKELKKRHIFYLDSFVTSKSVCFNLAHKLRLPIAKRDVFLDNIADPVYIKQQINKLKTKARIYGEAIGIGHDRKNTLEVLSEVMPELAKEGYKFVFLSEFER